MLTNREVPEGTRLLSATPERLNEIWAIVSQISGVFDDFTRGRPDMFLRLYLDRNTWWLEREDGNGILYMTSIRPGLSAFAHFIYWDKRLRGREEFTLNCLLFGMERFDLRKVNATIPEFAGAAMAFAQRLGFTEEGRIRDWSISNGKPYTEVWYGITREEAQHGAGNIRAAENVQQSSAVPGDGILDEVAGAIHGEGSSSSADSIDTVQPTSDVGNGREHQSESASNKRVPYENPENGGD